MFKRSFYFLAIVIILIASFFFIRKIKRNYAPRINLSGIALKGLNGKDVDLAAFTGKPLVINFWGTWCGPCRQEFPGFERAKQKFGDQVHFIMVSDEPADKISKFKTENTYSFFYAQSGNSFKELGITSVPITYFYDASGNLFAKQKDPLTEEEINSFITDMVK